MFDLPWEESSIRSLSATREESWGPNNVDSDCKTTQYNLIHPVLFCSFLWNSHAHGLTKIDQTFRLGVSDFFFSASSSAWGDRSLKFLNSKIITRSFNKDDQVCQWIKKKKCWKNANRPVLRHRFLQTHVWRNNTSNLRGTIKPSQITQWPWCKLNMTACVWRRYTNNNTRAAKLNKY